MFSSMGSRKFCSPSEHTLYSVTSFNFLGTNVLFQWGHLIVSLVRPRKNVKEERLPFGPRVNLLVQILTCTQGPRAQSSAHPYAKAMLIISGPHGLSEARRSREKTNRCL